MFIVSTTTWNTKDMLELFLLHYEALGVDAVHVVDYHSHDGTQELLTSVRWRDFVNLVSATDKLDERPSRVLPLLQQTYPAYTLCLFCDADELLVTPNMTVTDVGLHATAGSVVPRFNMTGPRSLVLAVDAEMNIKNDLFLQVLDTVQRTSEEKLVALEQGRLEPPWIYTNMPGKVLVNLGDTTDLASGNHSANVRRGELADIPPDCYLLHYPFRSFAEFVAKIAMVQIEFEEGPERPWDFGWHQRRWLRLKEKPGGLKSEYLQQFVSDGHIEPMIRSGRLRENLAVRDFVHGSRVQGSEHGNVPIPGRAAGRSNA